MSNLWMQAERKKPLEVFNQLEAWLEGQGFRGWEPYDALNSPVLKRLAFHRWTGIFFVQLLRRAPINFRPFLGIPKDYNPKGMGLFLSAYAQKYRSTRAARDREKIFDFADWLVQNASKGYSGMAWGYNFDWPNRSFYAPKGTPTVVNASFIGSAFLDAYRGTGDEKFLEYAASICDFIVHDLYCAEYPDGRCSSYTPLDSSCTHNANMLAAAFLAEVGNITSQSRLVTEADIRMKFSISRQREDGSWFYGEANNQQWIDSFHTGYNLIALDKLAKITSDKMYESALRKGYAFYLEHFFLDDGTVKYYHNKAHPLDAHAFACAMICLKSLSYLDERSGEILRKVFKRTLELFWSGKGYFYFKRGHFLTTRIPYIRWVQAWMFLALVSLCDS
ncbi:delta-aminolevulinic acid dehydratase [Candidatus Poribacteria bacterium]|nr:delta-aminolevulinic acid dehydratase [Candidatus Poribacteria bacterium]